MCICVDPPAAPGRICNFPNSHQSYPSQEGFYVRLHCTALELRSYSFGELTGHDMPPLPCVSDPYQYTGACRQSLTPVLYLSAAALAATRATPRRILEQSCSLAGVRNDILGLEYLQLPILSLQDLLPLTQVHATELNPTQSSSIGLWEGMSFRLSRSTKLPSFNHRIFITRI